MGTGTGLKSVGIECGWKESPWGRGFEENMWYGLKL